MGVATIHQSKSGGITSNDLPNRPIILPTPKKKPSLTPTSFGLFAIPEIVAGMSAMNAPDENP